MRYARVVWWFLVALVALSVVDAWTTWVLIRRGGIESNPYARYVIDHLGLVPAVLLRVFIGCFIAWAFARSIQRRPETSTLVVVGTMAACVVAWWGAVCVNNLHWLNRT